MIFWKKLSADELKEKGDKNHDQGNYQDALKCYTYETEVEAFFYENRYHQEIFKVFEKYCLNIRR